MCALRCATTALCCASSVTRARAGFLRVSHARMHYKDWCNGFHPSCDSWAENKSEGLVCGARAGRRLKSATRPYIGAPVKRTLKKAAAQAKGGMPSEAL